MNAEILTRMEREAVGALCDWESIKIAAYHRHVSEHTQKNQIKTAMAKLGVSTQIGLVKEFVKLAYGVEIKSARQVMALMLMFLLIGTMGSVDQTRVNRARRIRRSETEYVVDL